MWIAKILSDLQFRGGEDGFESEYIPKKGEMTEWIVENGQMSGKKEQMVLGMKQFDFIKELCVLSKEPAPFNLDVLRKMYLNKHKPIQYLQSRL